MIYKLYVDNIEMNSNTLPSGDIQSSNSVLRIGEGTSATNRVFDGVIDEVRVYNRALSANEVAELYRAGERKVRY